MRARARTVCPRDDGFPPFPSPLRKAPVAYGGRAIFERTVASGGRTRSGRDQEAEIGAGLGPVWRLPTGCSWRRPVQCEPVAYGPTAADPIFSGFQGNRAGVPRGGVPAGEVERRDGRREGERPRRRAVPCHVQARGQAYCTLTTAGSEPAASRAVVVERADRASVAAGGATDLLRLAPTFGPRIEALLGIAECDEPPVRHWRRATAPGGGGDGKEGGWVMLQAMRGQSRP